MCEELLIDIPTAAKRLNIGRTKLYEMLDAGEIASVHVGKLHKVVVADLSRYIERLLEEERANSGV
jgi:excisionase family DNA binding protein